MEGWRQRKIDRTDTAGGIDGSTKQIWPAGAEELTERTRIVLPEGSGMSRKLYISDCHFFHRALLKSMDHRPFADLDQMHSYMIRQWNAAVGPRDEVYILGDFSYGKGPETMGILDQLRGRLHLIMGNHDRWFRKLDQEHLSRFVWAAPYKEIRDQGRHVILSHYPIFCYNGQYHVGKDGSANVYMLYGHVHDTRDERLVHHFLRQTRQMELLGRNGQIRNLPCQMINTFCMFSDYRPITLSEWIELDARRRKQLDLEMADMEKILHPDGAGQDTDSAGAKPSYRRS